MKRLNPVLRRLGRQVVVDAILPIEEKGRRGLKAAAQRHQQAGSDVSLREASSGGLRSIHCHIERRVIEILLDAGVGDAGHLANLAQDLVGDLTIVLDIGSFDLNIDRRRQAKVQNLGDDIRG